MEILGVGPAELVFIIIIALIVLGPKDMQKTGRTIGKWLRQIVTSDAWKIFQQTSHEIQTLPNRLMRESALEDELKDVQKDLNQALRDPAGGSRPAQPASLGTPQPAQTKATDPTPPTDSGNSIMPPAPPAANDEEKNA